MSTDILIYLLRPNRTSLWLPSGTAKALGLKRRQMLTEAQFQHPEVQALLAARQNSEKKGGPSED